MIRSLPVARLALQFISRFAHGQSNQRLAPALPRKRALRPSGSRRARLDAASMRRIGAKQTSNAFDQTPSPAPQKRGHPSEGRHPPMAFASPRAECASPNLTYPASTAAYREGAGAGAGDLSCRLICCIDNAGQSATAQESARLIPAWAAHWAF
jgi:hypothetical protein